MAARSDGQKPVICMMREEFIASIDDCAEELGMDRSSFIREAVYTELLKNGIEIPAIYKTSPSRKGKGGRKAVKAPKKKTAPKKFGVTRGRIDIEEENQTPKSG